MSATKEKLHDQIEAGMRKATHKISWLNMPGYKGETWNPIVGCSKISEGCENCYAERMAVRLAGMNQFKYKRVITDGKWNGHMNWYLSDDKPRQWKTPRMIFVCSMGDLFFENIAPHMIGNIFYHMAVCENHIFIVLTKRPARALEFFTKNPQYANLPNVWLGVTAENQQRANERIPILLQIKAAKHFVSIEPMLGPVDLTNYVSTSVTHYEHQLDWVICGGETGPKARPMHPDWVRSLRDQCQAAQVPFFFKQWGEWIDDTVIIVSFENGKRVEKRDEEVSVIKVGHKAAGRLLDGVEYNEFPERRAK